MKEIIKKLLSSVINRQNEKVLFATGVSYVNLMRPNYKNIKHLSGLEYKVYSQNGEDGIIDYLIYCLNITIPKFIEIGTDDYGESNTRFLFERTSCKGLIIDSKKDLKKAVEKRIKLWRGDLTILEEKITSKNILNLVKENDFYSDLDILSLDIDGIDYWVLKSLPNKFSKILIVEYNSIFGPNLEISVPNLEDFDRKKYHYSNLCYGASLKAIINLMQKKGYVFVGTNMFRCNAFFVLQSEVEKINIIIPDLNNLSEFTDSNYRESRSKDGKLNYLSKQNRLKEIKNCEIINLANEKNNICKIKDILNY